jgi:hypothetical protein
MTTFDDAKKILDRYLQGNSNEICFHNRVPASNGFATICQSYCHNFNWQRLEIFELESAA